MTTTASLDGRQLAKSIREEVRRRTAAIVDTGVTPGLAVVIAEDNEAGDVYTRSLCRAAEAAGITASTLRLKAGTNQDDAAALISQLSRRSEIHGIILQSPLPAGVDPLALAEGIGVDKDIDGVTAASVGRLVLGLGCFSPATSDAVMELLATYDVALSGTRTVIVGRSQRVGRPLVSHLLHRDATVTVCHSRTRELASVTREADVLIVAVGRPHLIGREHVGDGAVVVDVGTNVDEGGRLVGDVDADGVEGVAGGLSPVPGGVGPVTTAVLLRHTVEAAERSSRTRGSDSGVLRDRCGPDDQDRNLDNRNAPASLAGEHRQDSQNS
jgi:methylenetetrahydrofolate dehydrogenase (NADP+)/methenyltetrahydrofolate cyclohydrolase